MKKEWKQVGLYQRKMSSARSEENSSFILILGMITRLVPDCYSVFLLISRSPFHGGSLPLYMLGSKYLGTNVLEL